MKIIISDKELFDLAMDLLKVTDALDVIANLVVTLIGHMEQAEKGLPGFQVEDSERELLRILRRKS